MITHMFGITWNIGWYAYAWIGIVLMMCMSVYRLYKQNTIVRALTGEREHDLMVHTSRMRRTFKTSLVCVGLFCLGLALLQPQWGTKEQTVAQEGRDLFIALDISRSMLAQDMSPSRLEAAKTYIKQLLPQLRCERVGLILFSGSSFIQCPLTEDYSAFTTFLDHADVETIASGSTSLAGALTQALDAFARMPNKKHKLMILLTDGEDFSDSLSPVQQRARQEGLHVFAVGLGSADGAPIPLYDDKGTQIGHQKDEHDKIVISRLDESTLRSFVHDGGGLYVRAADGVDGMRAVVQRIQSFEKEQFEDRSWTQLKEQYPYFVAVSLGAFLLEWLV